MLEANVKRVFIGRLVEDEDVLEKLSMIVKEKNIPSGAVQLIGSLKKVRVGFFNRETGEYDALEGEGFYELISGVGDISWRGDDPVVHVHIAAASHEGEFLMGHLLPGNIADATVEYIIFEFDKKIMRKHDPDTGLYLMEV